MSQSQAQTNVPQVPKAEPFKKKHKLKGQLASVAVMWLDYVIIYYGLTNGDTALISAGMAVMLFGAWLAYYFG